MKLDPHAERGPGPGQAGGQASLQAKGTQDARPLGGLSLKVGRPTLF